MSIVSAADRNTYRAATTHTIEPVINLVPYSEVASATISATPSVPFGQLAVSGTSGWSNVKVGQMVVIKNTSGLPVSWGVVRKTPDAAILYIDAKSDGDSGFARDISSAIISGYTVSILKFRPAWGLLSRISNGVQYKQFDVPYTNQGSSPDPVPVLGSWRQAFVNTSSNTARVSFDASSSYAHGSNTITAYSWSLDGGTLVAGSLSGSTLTGEFAPGFYEITCTVTSSNGKTCEGYRYLWVNTSTPGDANAPFNWRYPVKITTDKAGRKGRALTLEITGDFSASTVIFPGMAMHLEEYASFGGTAVADGTRRHTYTGYADDLNTTTEISLLKRITLNFQSPLARAKQVPTATQEMIEKSSPATWQEVSTTLSHPLGAAWYTAYHHAPYLIKGHDFLYQTGVTSLRRRSFGFQQDNIEAQFNTIEQMMAGLITCRSDGTIKLWLSPMHASNTDRNALDTKFTWGENDLRGALELAPRLGASVGHVIGGALAWDGNGEPKPYRAIAPGYSQAQGVGKADMPDFIVTATGGQTRLNEVIGHEWRNQNPPLPNVTLPVLRNIDICEPADMDWHVLGVPRTYLAFNPDVFGVNWDSMRMLVDTVNVSWRQTGRQYLKDITVEMRPETFGRPGVFLPVDQGGALAYLPDLSIDYEPDVPDFGLGDQWGVALVWNSDGALGMSQTFVNDEVTYTALSGFSGLVRGAAWDWGSAWITSGYVSGALAAWIATEDSGTVRVYKCADLLTAPNTWTEQANFTVSGTIKVALASSKTTTTHAIVAAKSSSGVKERRTTNSGTTWSSAAQVGAGGFTDSDPGTYDFGVVVEGSDFVVADLTATDTYKLYKASGSGAWGQLGGAPSATTARFPCVQNSNNGKLYVALHKPVTPDATYTVNFDGGYSDYQLDIGSAMTGGTGSVTSGGQSGNGAVFSGSNWTGGANNLFDVMVEIPPTQVTAIQFALKVNWTGTPASGGPWYPRIRIWTSGGTKSVPTGTQYECQTAANFFWDDSLNSPTRKGSWYTYTANVNLPQSDIQFIEVGWRSNTTANVTTSFDCVIDDIIITTTGASGPRLYRIDAFATAPAWVDVTPVANTIPLDQSAVAVDQAAAANLTIITTDPDLGTKVMRKSADNGGSWSTVESNTTYDGLKRSDINWLLWGNNVLDFTPDSYVTAFNRLGDWISSVGNVGTIEGVLLLV